MPDRLVSGEAGKLWQILQYVKEGGLYQRGGLHCILKDEYNLGVWRVGESQSWLTRVLVEMARAQF